MNILLIYPPNKNQGVYSKDFCRMKGCDIVSYPPLGLMYLQSMIRRERPNDNIKLFDLSIPKNDRFNLENYLRIFNPQAVGMTAYTLCFYDVLSICKIIKQVNKNTKIVLGGPHIDLYPEQTLEHAEIDYIIFGDGEYPFLNLINAMDKKADISNIESLYLKDKHGQAIRNKRAKVIRDLDSLPFPCRDDIDFSAYFNPLFKEQMFATVSSSRGCPYHCTYCDVTDKVFRSRGSANVVDELEYLQKKYGINNFFFVDDTFNITPARVIDICDEILRRALEVKWIFRGRIDNTTSEMLEKCKQAGSIHIIFGVEDSTDEGLRLIGKNISVSQTISVLDMSRKYDIKTTANFIIGFPHHKTKNDILRINDFLKKTAVDNIQISVLIPFPGSKIFSDGVRRKVIDETRWIDYVKNPTQFFELPLWEEYLSLNELTVLYEKIIKKFYLNPRNIIKKIFEIKSWFQLKQYIRLGLATLRIGKKRTKQMAGIHPEELLPTTIVRDRFHSLRNLTFLMKSKAVLDIGAGTGYFAKKFSQYAGSVYATDLSFPNVALGNRLANSETIVFVNADAHYLPFKANSMDIVFFSCVLEHFAHPDMFYDEICRVLKPGGRVMQSIDIRPILTVMLYRLTFLFDKCYGVQHSMIHKKTLISDDSCQEFISIEKLKRLFGDRFAIIREEKYAGLNFNIVQVALVIVNKLYQIFLGNMIKESNYADHAKNLDKGMFRFYIRFFLPIIKKLLHPRMLTFDAIYHYMLLQKAKP